MNVVENFIIKNNRNRFGFFIQIEQEEFATNFKIHQIQSSGENDKGEDSLFLLQVVSGYIKWDGCSNVNYGESGYIHFCESDDFITMHKAIEFVWKKAEKQFLENKTFDYWKVVETNIESYTGLYEMVED